MTDEFEFPRVVLSCRICGDDCLRSMVDGAWVHKDDFIHIRRIVGPCHDHAPDLGVIDTKAVDADAPTKPARKPRTDPFEIMDL
jgi:hypothetical protein